ncbi:hypothetical protein CAter282_2271 [Collimonas arenae]|uniref:Uncharacterized protein n=1 Tax=Collimonas arenae TaxID=279058 RepID=A0A127QIY3_9BURK|nr:hypothetical protein CAter10_2473 [Collimonas arenae]AMP10021.1 hypothetical protein CAter282_2271 [Collimonas arenae]
MALNRDAYVAHVRLRNAFCALAALLDDGAKTVLLSGGGKFCC